MNQTLHMNIPEKPVKKESLIGEEMEEDNEVVYVDTDTESVFSLNNTASAILDLCDGVRTSKDIAAVVSDALAIDFDQAFKDTEAVLEEFTALGIIS
ncbi:MAG: PqqD family protein [Ghiorsea sp.]